MKLRSKLLLSATCLLTISVAATATSAYAWFTANRQAEVKLVGADVKTNATNLYIAGTGTTLKNGNTVGFAEFPSEGQKLTSISATTTTSFVATDISGNGVNFYKPNLAPDFTNTNQKASSIVSAENNSTSGKYFYHQFELSFIQSNKDVTTGVYLSHESTVKQTSGVATGIEKAVRVAFLDSSNNLLLYWAPNEDSNSTPQTTYLKGTSDNPVEMNKANETCVGAFTDITSQKYLDGTFKEDINDASTNKTHNSKLLELNNNAASTIKVRVWFEGMDSDCLTGITNSTIDVSLKFNGVNMGV